MNADEYETLLDVLSEQPPSFTIPLLKLCRLELDQFRELLSLCESRGEADALIGNNGPIVAYLELMTPDPAIEEVYATVKSSPSAEAASVAMKSAPRAVFEHVATRLTIERYDVDTLYREYKSLMETET